jgi:hypothetical protein
VATSVIHATTSTNALVLTAAKSQIGEVSGVHQCGFRAGLNR